jgi:hypothetical protein
MRSFHAAAMGLLLAAVAADVGLQSASAVQPATQSVVVTVDRNASGATRAFKFARVPSPVADDAAAKAKVTLADGELDGQAGAVGSVTDGLLPRDEDEPGANFFFNAATTGGRLVIDLTRRVSIAQINSYSWHPNTRGPQVYELFASDGTDPKFNAAPRADVDPVTVGWVRVTAVDTRPSGEDQGGQYGVSIAGRSGSVGQFRYLLFDCSATEMQDDYGNTFYSEIDVIAAPATAPWPRLIGSAAPTSGPARR